FVGLLISLRPTQASVLIEPREPGKVARVLSEEYAQCERQLLLLLALQRRCHIHLDHTRAPGDAWWSEPIRGKRAKFGHPPVYRVGPEPYAHRLHRIRQLLA